MTASDLTPVIMHVRMAGSRFFAAAAALFVLGQQTNYPPKTGVKTPGIQIPVARLKPQATFALSGRPDWMALDDHVWVSNEPKDVVSELDPKTNAVLATIQVGQRPCSGLA